MTIPEGKKSTLAKSQRCIFSRRQAKCGKMTNAAP
jgi:hypothetical protein